MAKISLQKGLYAITPDLKNTAALLNRVEQALSAGLSILQYRDKISSVKEKRARASALHELCVQFNTPLIINDDPELALMCDSEGVHLGQSDGSIQQARNLLGANAIIGVTCHHQLALALKAEQEGADYVALGRFFNSNSKPGASLATTQLLIQAKTELSIPIVVIGGINHSNAQTLIDNGANYIAVIEQIFLANDIKNSCQHFNRLFEP